MKGFSSTFWSARIFVKPTIILSDGTKRLFGWIGLGCLLLIIPVKAVRWTDMSLVTSTIFGIAPSVLGPPRLLFLILSSSSRRLPRLMLLQTALLVGAIAIGLEFTQLIPRPGILAKVHYTFDWFDIAATLFSVSVGYLVARLLTYSKR
jgi:hypothetical protein